MLSVKYKIQRKETAICCPVYMLYFLKGASYITNHIYRFIYTRTHTHATDKIVLKVQHIISYGDGKGDVGYVHCALTPPLKGRRSVL